MKEAIPFTEAIQTVKAPGRNQQIDEGGYTVYRSNTNSESAWQEPTDCNDPMYIRLQSTLIPKLDKILATIPKLNKQDLTDQQTFAALISFFSNNFKYKIRKLPENGDDPVIDFMTKNREGHCELFASSLALLLRRLGIPTRYISGFVCAERHPSGSYFVARLGDAHA
ncbi:MAG: hypothetical protein GY750_09755 [Lentisphaerae bacterium]|nr:hypothetical protein [Lentisphaerota bacterium]MCP4101695.1 hypothetical protein [Lentisphaerota bacterium]